MPGRLDRNLRMGNLAEDLGVLMMSSFCAVAPVPRTQDFGIDVIATLLRSEGGRRLFAEESFYVQIKSTSVRDLALRDDAYQWFKRLELPLFIARVDVREATLELYTCVGCKQYAIEREYAGIHLVLGPDGGPDGQITKDGLRIARLGTPVISVSMPDLADPLRLARCYEIVRLIARVEQENRLLVNMRSTILIRWKTNELPRSNGRVTLVNVSADQYESEILRTLNKTLRNSLLGLAHDPENVAAVLPLLQHIRRRGHMSDEDATHMENLLRLGEGMDANENQTQANCTAEVAPGPQSAEGRNP